MCLSGRRNERIDCIAYPKSVPRQRVMAVTSIWAVHNSVKDVLDYAANPEKTENPKADD